MNIDAVTETTQRLLEMPFLMAGTVDWNLPDPQHNRRQLARVLANNPTIVQQDPHGVLYSVSTMKGGQYCFVSTISGLIEYFMQYEDAQHPDLKQSATQIAIWNRRGPPGITTQVF